MIKAKKRIFVALFIAIFYIIINVSALDTSNDHDLTISLDTNQTSGANNQDLTISLDTVNMSGANNQDLTISLDTNSTSGANNQDLTISIDTNSTSGANNQDLTISIDTNSTSGANNQDLTVAIVFQGSKEYPTTIVSLSSTWLTSSSSFSLSCSDIWASCTNTYLKIVNYDESCSALSAGSSGTLDCTGLSCKKKLCFYSVDEKGNQETLKSITFTIVAYKTTAGSPTGWNFSNVNSPSVTVRSGNPTNWTWRQTEPLSGRQVIHGSPENWSWISE